MKYTSLEQLDKYLSNSRTQRVIDESVTSPKGRFQLQLVAIHTLMKLGELDYAVAKEFTDRELNKLNS